MVCKKEISFLLFLLTSISLSAQVYNYSPVSYYDFETNPSILASKKQSGRINISSQNSFSSAHPFSINSVRLSKYFESQFTGLGLSLNNSIIGKNISYNQIGLSAGYRNVLFNKVFIKVGATYKVIHSKASTGYFDYYTFNPSGFNTAQNFEDNMNLSLSLSTTRDNYFISFAQLNMDLPWSKTNNSIQFPGYSVINIGNLMSFFNRNSRDEISYTAFTKSAESTGKLMFTQYINSKFNFLISRKTGIQYGGRIGYSQKDFLHINPQISHYSEHLIVTAAFNYYFDAINFHQKYFSSTQISLIYIL